MTEAKPINIGIVIIVIAVVIAISSFLYELSQNNNSIITIKNNTNNQTVIPGSNNANQTFPQIYTIEIKNSAFIPINLTIKKGDSITWINKDSSAHTITSDSGNELSSSSLLKDESYTHQFNFDGTYGYHCNFHSNMEGIITVEL